MKYGKKRIFLYSGSVLLVAGEGSLPVTKWRKTEFGERVISDPSSECHITLGDQDTPLNHFSQPLVIEKVESEAESNTIQDILGIGLEGSSKGGRYRQARKKFPVMARIIIDAYTPNQPED